MVLPILVLFAATFPEWLIVPGSNPKILEVGAQLESTFQLGGSTAQASAYYQQLFASQGFAVTSPRAEVIQATRAGERVSVTLRQNGEAVDVRILTKAAPPSVGTVLPRVVPRYPNGRVDRDYKPKANTLGMKWLTADTPEQAEAWYGRALPAAGFTIQGQGKAAGLGSIGNSIVAVDSSGEHAVRVNFVPLFAGPNAWCAKQDPNNPSPFAGVLACSPEPQSKTAVELTYVRLR